MKLWSNMVSIFRSYQHHYYLHRFLLTFVSWIYWIRTPKEELGLDDRDLYWSVYTRGHIVAANLWCMLNDGAMDMENEFYDT
jgi:hypothetical protein